MARAGVACRRRTCESPRQGFRALRVGKRDHPYRGHEQGLQLHAAVGAQ